MATISTSTSLLLLLSLGTALSADFTVDLRMGTYSQSPSSQGITWVSKPSFPHNSLGPCACETQGVLKLTFDKGNRTRAEIKLSFQTSKAFSFNIGDSSSNNGDGGDSSTQDSDAEVHAWNKDLRFYGKGVPDQPASSYGHLYTARNMLRNDVIINVQDQLVTVQRGRKYVHMDTFKTFNLNGQYDSQGPVNYDIYVGMNRVIHGSYRSGTGLCNVEITWHSDRL